MPRTPAAPPQLPAAPGRLQAGAPVGSPRPDVTARPVGRLLHPWAWWGWALGVGVAASLTTHPWLLLGLAVTVVAVVLHRRDDSPWGRAIWAYVALAAAVVLIRVVLMVLTGGGGGSTVLFSVPRVPLPDWAVGVSLGGPVTAERLLGAVQDALRLGLVLIALGAANSLANPRRALRSVPGALYDVSVAVVIAVTVAPQLVESTLRVRHARRLRGGRTGGLRVLRTVAVPVLEDAVDRSLALAAAMESRGFGSVRRPDAPAGGGRGPGARTGGTLLTVSLVLLVLGTYLLLGGQAGVAPAVGVLLVGVLAAAAGLVVSGRRVAVTRYRPDPWRAAETLVVVGGVLAGLAVAAWSLAQPALLHPAVAPLGWPPVHPGFLVVLALVALPAVAAPEPPTRPGAIPGGDR